MHFGEKFKALLEQKGVTYEAARIALGYKSKGSITNLTKADIPPRQDKLYKICDYLGVPYNFFDELPEERHFSQPEISYETQKHIIPLMENESADAMVLTEMVIPQMGITDAFAVEINDNRLENIGIPCGTTLFLARKFTLSAKHEVIVQKGKNRFFALYEKRGTEEVLTPADPEMRRIVLNKKNKSGIEIFAVVVYKLCRANISL